MRSWLYVFVFLSACCLSFGQKEGLHACVNCSDVETSQRFLLEGFQCGVAESLGKKENACSP